MKVFPATVIVFRTVFFTLLLLCVFCGTVYADYITDHLESWKPYFIESEPLVTVHRWRVPFDTVNRFDIGSIKMISPFGVTRFSYLRGHIHTGADIVPRRKRSYVYVYPLAPGVVCSIHLGHPHKTVVVKHRTTKGEIIFTSYKHLHEIYVRNGQQVRADTRLARLYTRGEALAQGGNYDHLHLEIRRKFDDYGVASWATMNRKALYDRFYDPWLFLKERVK